MNRLTARNPFKTDNYWESLKLNTDCHLHFHALRVPDVVRHLVQGLTLRHPRHRLTAEDALKHPAFSLTIVQVHPHPRMPLLSLPNKENTLRNQPPTHGNPLAKPIVLLQPVPAPAKVAAPVLRTLPKVASIPHFQTHLANKPATLLEIPEADETPLKPLRTTTMNVLPGSHRPLLAIPSLDLSVLPKPPTPAPQTYHGMARTRTMLDLGASLLTPRAPLTAREPSLLL